MTIMPLATSPFQQMCATTMAQGLLVNDQPLNAPGRIEQTWDGMLGSQDLIGTPIHVPLRPGAMHIPQVTGTREFVVGMLIFGENNMDEDGHNRKWRDLVRIVWSPTKPLVLKRRMVMGAPITVPGQPAVTETHYCQGKYMSGLVPNYVVGRAMSRVALRFQNLDGYWWGATNTVATIAAGSAATVKMLGDAESRNMTITFSGGSDGVHTITNTFNKCVLSYTGSTTPDVVLDVMNFTATQGGVNVMKNISHVGDVFWMRLEPPGPLGTDINALTFTGSGTVSISAKNAFL